MTEQQEKAMRMALEALKKSHPISNSNEDLYAHSEAGSELYNELKKAKALAQPVQEPVGTYEGVMEAMLSLRYGTIEQLQVYDHMKDKLLYAAPPQKEWVGLTDEEFEQVVEGLEDLRDCWIQIEAKLKEKNT